MTPFAGNFSSAVAAAEEAARETVKADEAVAAGLRRGRVVREHGRADGRDSVRVVLATSHRRADILTPPEAAATA